MSLYTCIDDDRGDFIVLNKKYTKEQLREKLLEGDNKQWVDYILDEGIYLTKPRVKKVYAKDAYAYLTTQREGYEVKFKKTQTIVVYPDGRWRDATFLEKLTKEVNDGMWGSVLCTFITFGNNEMMTFFSNEYDKKEIEEQLSLKKCSKEVVNDIMQVGRYYDYPQLVKLSVAKGELRIVEQYIEGGESRTKSLLRKRWLVVYPNAFWRFATWKEIMSGTVLG